MVCADSETDASSFGPQNLAAYMSAAVINGTEVAGEFAMQVKRMPSSVRKLLVDSAAPCSISPETLLQELQLTQENCEKARHGLDSTAEHAILRLPHTLSPCQCAALRAAVDSQRQERPDSVDGAPDHQLNLSREELEALIGAEATAALWRLPQEFRPLSDDPSLSHVEVFVRRYTAETRPWNPFHNDSAAVTVNVALGDDLCFSGGHLLACFEGAVRPVVREEGEATVHASTLLHGVTMMTAGVRYSLIMFFGVPQQDSPTFSPEMCRAEAEALKVLMSDVGFLARCQQQLGEANFDALMQNYSVISAKADVGRTVSSVVGTYGAPYLRPTCMRERALLIDAVCWSMHSLLKYARQERDFVPLPH